MALVPLVVVITMVCPRRSWPTYAKGELPYAKPWTTSPLRSAAAMYPFLPMYWAASSMVETGMIRSMPFSKAATMALVARSTSMTTTMPISCAYNGYCPGMKQTSTRYL